MPQKRYRTSAHSRYTIYYHFVFCPKYRREIFKELTLEKHTKEAIKKMSFYHDWVIEELETDQDHLHVFLSAPPRYSPSQIVKLIKTWTYNQIYDRHPEIKKYLWGGKMWCEGYYVSTISDKITKEEIRRYVRQQKEYLKQLRLL
jgi:putative transposase